MHVIDAAFGKPPQQHARLGEVTADKPGRPREGHSSTAPEKGHAPLHKTAAPPQAEELASRIGSAVRANGLREYYHPYTGKGMGAVQFAWSTLAMEMIDPDPRAPSSYLETARLID